MDYALTTDETNCLLILKLEGSVDYASLIVAVDKAESILVDRPHLRLLYDGTQVVKFNIPNAVCQQMAPNLFRQKQRAAFYSESPLAFGMARVIQTYSFNENIGVFKSRQEATQFIFRQDQDLSEGEARNERHGSKRRVD